MSVPELLEEANTVKRELLGACDKADIVLLDLHEALSGIRNVRPNWSALSRDVLRLQNDLLALRSNLSSLTAMYRREVADEIKKLTKKILSEDESVQKCLAYCHCEKVNFCPLERMKPHDAYDEADTG